MSRERNRRERIVPTPNMTAEQADAWLDENGISYVGGRLTFDRPGDKYMDIPDLLVKFARAMRGETMDTIKHRK